MEREEGDQNFREWRIWVEWRGGEKHAQSVIMGGERRGIKRSGRDGDGRRGGSKTYESSHTGGERRRMIKNPAQRTSWVEGGGESKTLAKIHNG